MAGSLTLRKIGLTGKQLRSVPEDKQVLLVQLGHVYNTIQMLQLFLVFTGKTYADDTKQKAAVAQNTLIARILASSYFEAWRVLEQSFFGTKLSAEYVPKLSVDSQQCLKRISKYFSGKNVVAEARNRFGFHFDRNDTIAELGRVVDTDAYDIFLSTTRGNSLIYLSEEVAGMSLLAAVQDVKTVSTLLEAQNALFRDIVDLSKDFQRLIEEVAALIVVEVKPNFTETTIEVTDVPELAEVSIPFFVIPPKSKSP